MPSDMLTGGLKAILAKVCRNNFWQWSAPLEELLVGVKVNSQCEDRDLLPFIQWPNVQFLFKLQPQKIPSLCFIPDQCVANQKPQTLIYLWWWAGRFAVVGLLAEEKKGEQWTSVSGRPEHMQSPVASKTERKNKTHAVSVGRSGASCWVGLFSATQTQNLHADQIN